MKVVEFEVDVPRVEEMLLATRRLKAGRIPNRAARAQFLEHKPGKAEIAAGWIELWDRRIQAAERERDAGAVAWARAGRKEAVKLFREVRNG